MENYKFFVAFDPIQSFGKSSLGIKRRCFVDRDGLIKESCAGSWQVGLLAYQHLTKLFSNSPPKTILAHEKNMKECLQCVDGAVALMASIAGAEDFKVFDQYGEVAYIKKTITCSLRTKMKIFDAPLSADPEIATKGHRTILLSFVYAAFYSLDSFYASYPHPINTYRHDFSDDLIRDAELYLVLLEKYLLLSKANTKKASNAAKTKHQETYKIKESLRTWHKNNRHLFLINGKLNQTKAGKEAVKQEPISLKKAAEYMGEFEKDFLNE